jgi:thioesterase domain-containing protein
MAVQLQEHDEEVALLAMFDAGHFYAFAVMLTFFKQDSQDMWSRLASPVDEQIAFFREKTARAQLIPPQADQQMARNIYRVVVANMRALYQYHPRPYRGKIVLFRARDKYIESRHDPAEEWKRLAREVEVIATGGDHLSLVHEPFVDELAGHLQQVLDRLPTDS